MTVVVPDYSPRPAPLGLSPSAAPAPAPVPGSDGDEDGTPRLPSERRGTGAPSSTGHSASAQAPAAATSTDFISSSPAVPLPAGVTDSATVLPMPTPGQHLRVTSRSPLLSSLKKLKIMACIVFFLSFFLMHKHQRFHRDSKFWRRYGGLSVYFSLCLSSSFSPVFASFAFPLLCIYRAFRFPAPCPDFFPTLGDDDAF